MRNHCFDSGSQDHLTGEKICWQITGIMVYFLRIEP